jgi:HEPN domain-containing protein
MPERSSDWIKQAERDIEKAKEAAEQTHELPGNYQVKRTYNKMSKASQKNYTFENINLFKKFQKSILVVSYRSDGIPSIKELLNLLSKYKQNVKELKRKNYKYVLSSNHSEDVLLIGR